MNAAEAARPRPINWRSRRPSTSMCKPCQSAAEAAHGNGLLAPAQGCAANSLEAWEQGGKRGHALPNSTMGLKHCKTSRSAAWPFSRQAHTRHMRQVTPYCVNPRSQYTVLIVHCTGSSRAALPLAGTEPHCLPGAKRPTRWRHTHATKAACCVTLCGRFLKFRKGGKTEQRRAAVVLWQTCSIEPPVKRCSQPATTNTPSAQATGQLLNDTTPQTDETNGSSVTNPTATQPAWF